VAPKRFIGWFAVGFVPTLVGCFISSSGRWLPRAAAQDLTLPLQYHTLVDELSADAGRYQISNWAIPAASSSAGSYTSASHGAYIIDTRSGRIWQILDDGDPNLIANAKSSIRPERSQTPPTQSPSRRPRALASNP
jgi:hypothetical protein